ncbi:MAG: DUF167 domain-containing protein [Hydrogenobacter sp.]
MIIEVRAKPKAKKEYVKVIADSLYEVATKEPPQEGRANERIAELLSEHFGIPKNRVKLIKGERSRVKLFRLDL